MINTANCVTDLIYRLGFQSSTDLTTVANYVSQTELYQWFDEEVQRLAYEAGAFVTWDTSLSTTPSTATYTLPASNVFTLLASWSGAILRISPVRELWALDATYSATSGTPQRASLDAGSVGTITLYPKPLSSATIGLVAQEYPATINASNPNVQLPSVFQDYLSYAALAGARGKESEGRMDDMADHYAARAEMYRAIAKHLFGSGQ
jgi:hypothetical protein